MKTIDEFNGWLSFIADNTNQLKHNLPHLFANELDGSLNSLNKLESYLIENYTCEQITLPKNSKLLEQLASYVGNIAQQELPGSYWTINLEDKKDVDFGFPILKFTDNRASFNPFTYITTALDRKRGTLISKAIENRKHP
ncbi:MAG: hypothetical protein JSS90_12330 [Bacteroidetes bacterium]|nr:hypothetical protein [Bacteroidota bacterium]